MKSLAIIGVRGIPVVYSGFETFAEELSTRLAKKGWRVSVFCRRHAVEAQVKQFRGVDLITLPSIRTKSLDTISHSLVSTLYACFMNPKPQIVYYLGVGSSIWSIIPRLFGIKTIVNVDGLDWKRGKWGRVAQSYLHLSEKLAIYFSNLAMTDSVYIQNYYKREYKQLLPVIPYGYSSEKLNSKILKKYSLNKGKYLIWTGRLVSDNHLDELIRAYSISKIKLPLIVLGDSPNEEEYRARLNKLVRGSNIYFYGFVDRVTYATLVASSLAYIETKRSGGTHPSLVESMGHGCFILANDHKSHRDVLGETALYYQKGNVPDLLKRLKTICSKNFETKRTIYQKITQKRAENLYSWGAIVEQYEKLFGEMVS